jgi:hypothetical protein
MIHPLDPEVARLLNHQDEAMASGMSMLRRAMRSDAQAARCEPVICKESPPMDLEAHQTYSAQRKP